MVEFNFENFEKRFHLEKISYIEFNVFCFCFQF